MLTARVRPIVAGTLLAVMLLPLAAASSEPLPEFAAICEKITKGSNDFLGTAQIAVLEAQVEAPGVPPMDRALTQTRLGIEYLRIGHNRRAIEALEAALARIEANSDDPRYSNFVRRRLGLAQLRLGEELNCVGGHPTGACILPLVPSARHKDPKPSLAAIDTFTKYLEVEPDNPVVQWLLNVAAMTVNQPEAVPTGARMPAGANASGYDIGHFPDVAHDVGLAINQQSGGGIMEDFNGDGHLDVVTTTIDVCGRMNLFLNDGKGRFVDHTEAAGLAGQLGGLNVVHADYDSDGDVDLLVLRGGWLAADGRMRNSLLRNDGQGRFTDVTGAAGLAQPAYPTQAAAWADYDSDGDLDLYIGNENQNNSANYPSQLFRNDKNKFTDVASEAGVLNYRPAKGVAWGDYDDDGDPDLYVSNIGANRLYRNNGDGTFRDVALTLNVTKPEGRSFPTWWFDYDNDGHLDLFVASYEATLNDVASGLMGRPTGRGYPKLYRNTVKKAATGSKKSGASLG